MTDATDRGPSPAMEKLAILVVYLVRDEDDLHLLRLHLARVRRHTLVPYTIYAAAHRATPAGAAILEAEPNVVLCDLTPTELRGSREHGYYLDALAPRAIAAGATHLVTLDIDSFPIDDRWIDVLEQSASTDSGVAAILRVENGDVALPHPSCMLLSREFFERYAPSFSPDSDMTPDFRRFLHTTGQAGDTGIRLAYTLWSEHLHWGKLLRTNVENPHYLIAGIYADVVFHLGAGARSTLFRADLEHSRAHRLTRPIERYRPRTASTARLKARVLTFLRSKSERRIIERNGSVAANVRTWLLRDSDALIAYLRGGDSGAERADVGGFTRRQR